MHGEVGWVVVEHHAAAREEVAGVGSAPDDVPEMMGTMFLKSTF